MRLSEANSLTDCILWIYLSGVFVFTELVSTGTVFLLSASEVKSWLSPGAEGRRRNFIKTVFAEVKHRINRNFHTGEVMWPTAAVC